jgi:hypothetical protein
MAAFAILGTQIARTKIEIFSPKEKSDPYRFELKGLVTSEKDQDWVASIMRGIAHITTKKPEIKNSYTTIIEILDSLHADKKVEEFKPKL